MNEPSARPVRNASRTGAVTAIAIVEVKRRACDACRSRKLACSKESDGCARCKKEGIVCHYSAQKPMGRPRKRATQSQSTQAAAAPRAGPDELCDERAGSCDGPDVAMMHDTALDLVDDPASIADPSLLCNADMLPSDMDLLDFLGSDFMLSQTFDPDKVPPAAPTDPTDWTISLHDVNFDAHHRVEPGTNASLTTPSLSSLSSQSPSPMDSRPSQPNTCSCLANLYLALDAVARLPTDVIPALHTARSAAHTAHDAICCETCCPPLHKTMKMTASAFQNSMLLGALIPSIADAYHQILGLVDAEATRAIATHTPLTFALAAYGGTWGTLSSCGPGSKDLRENKVMEPAAWRLSVRNLLKIDVYGVSALNYGGKAQFRQIGLRDLVAEMDEKSRERHAEVDALIEAGLPAPIGMNGLPARHTHGKEPHCRHVVQLAREAVENLYIA